MNTPTRTVTVTLTVEDAASIVQALETLADLIVDGHEAPTPYSAETLYGLANAVRHGGAKGGAR